MEGAVLVAGATAVALPSVSDYLLFSYILQDRPGFDCQLLLRATATMSSRKVNQTHHAEDMGAMDNPT